MSKQKTNRNTTQTTHDLISIYLFMSRHEVHSMNTHTMQNASW